MNKTHTLTVSLFAALAAGALAQAQPTLLDVNPAPIALPAGVAPGGPRTCRVTFDMKFTANTFAGWVSAGAGGTGVFGSGSANGAGDRSWALESMAVPAYGVVRYNTFGGTGHLHVKHIAESETDAALTASGQRVLTAWRAHYGRVGMPAKKYPSDLSPNAIRNSYAQKPAGLVGFQTGATGIPKGAAANRIVERSQKEEWKTHAWPAFAQAVAMQAVSPWTAGPILPQLEKQASWTGPDHQATLTNLLASARAMMPKYADKVPAVPANALMPRYAATRAGTGWKITGTAAPVALTPDASLASWQRELSVDETGQVTSDKLAITIALKAGRVEVTLDRVVAAPRGSRTTAD